MSLTMNLGIEYAVERSRSIERVTCIDTDSINIEDN